MNNYEQYTPEIIEMSEKNMQMIREGKIRNHKLRNTASLHYGEQEMVECYAFRDFLQTKNFSLVYELKGSDNR